MKSYAKINIFLKIVGKSGNYHQILSRFILHKELFDEISFTDKVGISSNVVIDGENIINKTIKAFKKAGFESEFGDFLANHGVHINKQIPMGAGLGGGSSNAGVFALMINDELNLRLKTSELIEITKSVGSDIAFFIKALKNGFNSANVSSLGEVVESFSDEMPHLSVFTPPIHSDTAKVYSEFRQKFMDKIDINLAKKLINLKSKDILQIYKNYELNDLIWAFLSLNPNFSLKDGEFLSGSGSSYFKVEFKVGQI
ncbi:MAG: 4-(cytidine 5'-diphospho)-2-C-methyl-D-erythritol kinase [Campylobacter sp.]|nr:4-(cytidine 5'-diphospho)-2-C-methyl-D-erythritol kinase [Campylobacter sp.]